MLVGQTGPRGPTRAWGTREHPGVEVVRRDGSLTYPMGVTAGSPDAVQVSDLFHSWQGPSRRVQDIASAHRFLRPSRLPAPAPRPLP
ncbi:hypothetical protein [Streptomyces sp. NBC_01013]|uniref:hypothetical protein n=1 Tax=Streptomyces sp. NBC_01013 TaxID=2903718 RepID=UPI00386773B0|nr:hypothetical protein OG538_00425 [Streptomyces sp. NBC_01013]